ncbi:GNAT family N-acetyltransferase [Mesorhizobium sp. CAU 1732]|uniref:GNAT family N-acetyltransferase n=1 Tax=Mesorhizobium sp. CAU 1732 TaxID=3140358 RepID=UPI0032605F12
MALVVAVETPLQDDVRLLVADLNDAMDAQSPDTPEEFNFRMTAEEMAGPETTVFVARLDGAAIGCGALLRHPQGYGEVKRMYVRAAAQGMGVAGSILDAIEARAVADGLSHLALETGDGFGAAKRVYERAGFVRCGAFADYPESPYSIFYKKTLVRQPAETTSI